jgi:hypothetical protein
LAGDDSAVGEEEDPDSVPAFAIFVYDLDHVRSVLLRTRRGERTHLFAVANPVQIPPPDSSAIMHAQDINILHFKPGSFDLVDNPAERARSICTREDVFIHEETPAWR